MARQRHEEPPGEGPYPEDPALAGADEACGALAGGGEGAPLILRGLVASARDLMAALDFDFRFVALNEGYRQAFLRHFGVRPALGDRFGPLLNHFPNEREEGLEAWGRALGGESFHLTREFADDRHESGVYEMIFYPLLDGAGQRIGAAHIARDITVHHQVAKARRASEERFRLVTEATREGVWDWNVLTGEVYYSPAYFTMLGYEPGQFPAHYRSWLELVHPADRDNVFRINRECVEGACETFEVESRMQARDGGWRWIMGRGKCIERAAAGRAVRLVGAHLDITDRKRAEEALRSANAALAEADRRKDEFLAMLAHELRNPLAPIRNAVRLLQHVAAGDPATAHQHEIIDRQITHMARLLDDLLDVSRITRGKIELERRPLRLADVLAQAVETAEPLIQARRHAFVHTPPPPDLWIEADLDRLAQAIGNLLANAAKYTESGGRIRLEAERVGGEAVVRVCDTGIGIAPEMLPRIFDLFAQADCTLDRTQGGLGIGLTLARNLVQMHGGSLEACSDGMGRGSKFVVRLPAFEVSAQMLHAPIGPEGAVSFAAAMRRVLVVDDVADTAESMAELIEVWGHTASAAYDGPAALEEAARFKPNVVLLDIGLPGMTGYEVARQLRREFGSKVLLVALTGYGQESDVLEARAAGFDHHMVKPVDLTAVRRLIEGL